MPRYGSVNHVPPYEERERYAVLQIMHRGQRLADQPYAAAYPGLLTDRIDDASRYVYRGIVADCLRGLEFLLARAQVDTSRVGIVGDDLALVVAGRRAPVAAVEAAALIFYRLMEARERTDGYPVEEINDYLRAHPDRRDAVATTLAYFDPIHHGPDIAATTMLSVGDPGSLSGADWLDPLRDSIAGPVEQYQLTHEGATDHDWLDAWLAGQLGTEPRPKMWEIAG
jgi:dienelactone hydrolase